MILKECKKLKSIFILLFALLFSFLLYFAVPQEANAATIKYSGTFGGCSWEIDTDGLLHIFPTNGASGTMTASSTTAWPWYNYRKTITNVSIEKGVAVKSAVSMFQEFSSVKTLDLRNLNTSNLSDTSLMFLGCSSLTSINLTNFNTSKVTSMRRMFKDCKKLTSVDLSRFNTAGVLYMDEMFSGCENLTSLNLSLFNTSDVINMSAMFKGCKKLTSLDLSNFDTSSLWFGGGIEEMFSGCSSLTSLNLSNFDTSALWYLSSVFRDCSSLKSLDLSSFNTSKVKDMDYLFYGCSSLTNVNLSSFNTSIVENMSYMFYGCSSLTNLDLSNFNTSKVTNMEGMFGNYSSPAALDLSNFNTSSVTNMSKMFSHYSSPATLNLSNFNTSSVTNMSKMFSHYSSSTALNLSSFNTGKVTNMTEMFSYYSSPATLNLSSFNTSSVTNMSKMFSYYSSPAALNLSGFNTSSVTDMSYMFENYSSPAVLNLSSFDTSSVTTMAGMFLDSSSLTTLDLSSFNTGNVTTMYRMFEDCTSLKTLDLNSFDTTSVETMSYMFSGCSSLTNLNLSSFDTINVKNTSYMFEGLTKLKSLDLSKFNTNNITNATSMFRSVKLNKIVLSNSFDVSVANFSTSNTAALWTKTKNLDGSKTYDKTAYSIDEIKTFNSTTTPSIGGTWVLGEGTADFNVDENGNVEYISDDNEWIMNSDKVWTYVFKVFDDTLFYYLFEEVMDGYVSNAMHPYFIEVKDNSATIVNNTPEVAEKTGKLIVSKTIDGIYKKDQFEITIQLSGENIGGLQSFNGVIFQDGIGKILLRGNESKEFDIPVGTTYTVTEKTSILYNTEITNPRGTIEEINPSIVNVKNTFVEEPTQKVGTANIILKKVLQNNDSEDAFVINTVFENLVPLTTYELSNGESFVSTAAGSGFYAAQLKHNEEIVFYNIPIGATYRFTEAAGDYISSYEIVDDNKIEGDDTVNRIIVSNDSNTETFKELATAVETVDEGEKAIITFINTFETIQNLIVSKSVKEELADGTYIKCETDEAFEITIKFSNMPARSSFSSSIGKVNADEYGEAYKTFYLKNGESVNFYKIPVGVEYVIEETANNYKPTYITTGLGVIKNMDEANINSNLSTAIETIEPNENAEVIFTNIKFATGVLSVMKNVEGTDTDTAFSFNITLEGDKISGVQNFNGIQFIDGSATFNLKNGESKKFNIPAGTTYTVVENSYKTFNTNYETQIVDASGEIIGNYTSENTATGGINKDELNSVTVTNIYTAANITLKKTVTNIATTEKFSIIAEFKNLGPMTIYYLSNGDSFTADADGNATYTAMIGHNEEIIFKDIPVNAMYKFTEIAGEYKASYNIVDRNKN